MRSLSKLSRDDILKFVKPGLMIKLIVSILSQERRQSLPYRPIYTVPLNHMYSQICTYKETHDDN